MVLKIGFLLDSLVVSRWQREIIQYVQRHQELSLQLVVLNVSYNPGKTRGREIYKLFRRIDRSFFSLRHDAFKTENAEALFRDVEVLRINTSKNKYITAVGHEDIELIKSKNLDVLVRFGFGIIKGELLQATRLGVWSLHHGDTAVNRGGPPGFWEVVNREAVTGVTLQQLTEKLDGGIVLGKAFTRTDLTSFNRNQNAVFWSGVELFCACLERVSKTGDHSELIKQNNQSDIYLGPLYRDPRNGKAIGIFLKFWRRRLKQTLAGMLRKQQWAIYVGLGEYASSLSMAYFKKLTPPVGMDWADPFIVEKDGRHYLFFEELPVKSKKAHISYLELDQITEKPMAVKVLEEDHHLSYPFVFEHDGQYYMLPEAATSKQLWLYRCEEFPVKWKKYSLLLKDVAVYDPTILFHEGYWYLFGTQKPLEGSSADQYLYLYLSKDLFSDDWQPHPQNPLTRDVRGARPAGRIFEYEGKLIRPSQIGAPKYGYGIRFHKIEKLTPTDYKEHAVHDVLPDWRKGLVATHTFNAEAEGGVMVVDGQGY
jgi:hypothetical protein